MALFNYSELSSKYVNKSKTYDYLAENYSLRKSTTATLDSIKSYDSFDIFLSHSYADRQIIPTLKEELESLGYSVYVDWITDRVLSRDNITKETAKVLQQRMQQSKCLLYATSENSTKSRWMPWELGYFDGIKNKKVGILPIKKYGNNFRDDFKGEEYLSLYYYVDKALTANTDKMKLWIRESIDSYIIFDGWLKHDLEPSLR